MMCPGYGMICMPRGSVLRRIGGVAPRSLCPKLTGVETLRAGGKPTVVSSGTSSMSPTITACSPKEVRVVQLRRPRSPHEVSSKLSANMASSSVKSVWCYGHQPSLGWSGRGKKKRPREARPLWNFGYSGGVRCGYCFGVSLGFGVVGFGVVGTGAFAAGLGALLVVEVGAATPDCTL